MILILERPSHVRHGSDARYHRPRVRTSRKAIALREKLSLVYNAGAQILRCPHRFVTGAKDAIVLAGRPIASSQEETFRVHGIPHAQSSTAYRQNFAEGRS